MSLKIKISFCPSNEVYCNLLENQIPEYFIDKFECCRDIVKSDIVVVWDNIPGHILKRIEGKKIIFIGAEPAHILNTKIDKSLFDNIFNYPSYDHDFLPVIWWINKNYNELKNLNYNDIIKSKKISCVVSNKWAKRTNFVKFASNKIEDLEVWGRWIYNNTDDDFKNSKSYMGELNGVTGASCKIDGIIPYDYSICIENTSIKNYWTEKIIDSLLCWTMPIYYGATNILDFFPENSIHIIDMSKKDIESIKEIITNKPSEEQIFAIGEARKMILDEYNFWVIINKLIEGGSI